LNWDNGYESQCVSVYLDFVQKIGECVLKDLRRATISIIGKGRSKDSPVQILKDWVNKKLSGEIWFQYLRQIWESSPVSSSQMLGPPKFFLHYIACTIVFLFSQIENEELSKLINNKNNIPKKGEYYVYSLYQVLMMTKVCVQQKLQSNNIYFLSYICQNSSEVLSVSNLQKSNFKELRYFKSLKKSIYQKPEAKTFVDKICESIPKDVSVNSVFDLCSTIKKIKTEDKAKSTEDDGSLLKAENVDDIDDDKIEDDDDAEECIKQMKKKRKIVSSKKFEDAEYEQQLDAEVKNAISKLARDERHKNRNWFGEEEGSDKKIQQQQLIPTIENKAKIQKKGGKKVITTKNNENNNVETTSVVVAKELTGVVEENNRTDVVACRSDLITENEQELTGVIEENNRNDVVACRSDRHHLTENEQKVDIDEEFDEEMDLYHNIRNMFLSEQQNEDNLEATLLFFYSVPYIKTDELLLVAINNFIYSNYEYQKQKGQLLLQNDEDKNVKRRSSIRINSNNKICFFNDQASQLIDYVSPINDAMAQTVEAEFKTTLYNSGSVLSKDPFLLFSVFKRIKKSTWFGDEIAHAYAELLNQRESALRRLDNLRIKIFYLEPVLFTSTIDKIILNLEEGSPAHIAQILKIKRSFKNLDMDLTDFDRIFLYANQGNSHWVLYEIELQIRKIHVYDSICNELSTQSSLQIQKNSLLYCS
jgi:hypothetical protein